MIDHVLNYLKASGSGSVMVDEYCELNFSMPWADLKHSENAEWIAGVLDLIKSGELRVLTLGRTETMTTRSMDSAMDKKIYTLDQLTDQMVAELRAMTEDERRAIRENMNWELLYDRKIKWDVIN